MPWLLNLLETYDAHQHEVGIITQNRFGRDHMLLPIAHTTQQAQIEVNVTPTGEFHSATVVEKAAARTVIPTTIDSASRAGPVVSPHPLHDKLSYTAGDYVAYGGKMGRSDPFQAYLTNLEQWVKSSSSHPTVEAIYRYLKQGRLIEDLVKAQVICLNRDGKMVKKGYEITGVYENERPRIFTIASGGQEHAFVRFRVYHSEEACLPPWLDRDVQAAYVRFYRDQLTDEDVCYVTGELLPSTDRHASKIRHEGDRAKLISGNDLSSFTFRGRFHVSEEVASVSYEASQKAHHALRWLIEKQGNVTGDRVYLTWANDYTAVADPLRSTYDLSQLMQFGPVHTSQATYQDTFSQAVKEYATRLTFVTEVNVFVIDSATIGRIGIVSYQRIERLTYFKRLKAWHLSCTWRHRYTQDSKERHFIGAPDMEAIALATYGPRVNDALANVLSSRILTCIYEGNNIPEDIINSAMRQASDPVRLTQDDWELTLSTACALINHQHGYDVDVEMDNNDRDYLYGRMLALADALERQSQAQRTTYTTIALRAMSAFSRRPARTWELMQTQRQTYEALLGEEGEYITGRLADISEQLTPAHFTNQPLGPRYLLGFASQRYALQQQMMKKKRNKHDVIKK